MFETNNEAVKVFSQGKLTSVKFRKMPNRKKKRPTDPDYVVKAVVDVATFDKNSGRQIDCVSSYLDMTDLYVLIEALTLYGRKAMHIAVSSGKKMPAVEIFSQNGGSDRNGEIISRKLAVSTGGPDKNAEFFITAEEAPGHVDDHGLYVKNKGTQSTKWISMSLSYEQVLAIAGCCQSAVSILNMWSATGTLWQNLDRIDPTSSSDNARDAGYAQAKARRQEQPSRNNSGYAAQGGRRDNDRGNGGGRGYYDDDRGYQGNDRRRDSGYAAGSQKAEFYDNSEYGYGRQQAW